MDDWIVKAVFDENQQIRAGINSIQTSIMQGERDISDTASSTGKILRVKLDAFELMPLDSAGLSSRKSTGMLPRLGSQAGSFFYGGFNIQ